MDKFIHICTKPQDQLGYVPFLAFRPGRRVATWRQETISLPTLLYHTTADPAVINFALGITSPNVLSSFHLQVHVPCLPFEKAHEATRV